MYSLRLCCGFAVALPADISSQTDSNDQGKIKNGCQTFRQVFKLFSPGLNETNDYKCDEKHLGFIYFI